MNYDYSYGQRGNADNQKRSETLADGPRAETRRRRAFGWGTAVTVSLLLLTASAAQAAVDARAENLLKEARVKEEQAQHRRAEAAVKRQDAADQEILASEDEQAAHLLNARAMQILKADANRHRAFELRHEARLLWTQAGQKTVEARNVEHQAAQVRHEQQELGKAFRELADQPEVAKGLKREAEEKLHAAGTLETTAATLKADAEALDRRAAASWAEAEKLDPEVHGKVAPPPAKTLVRPPVVKAAGR